MSRRATNPHFYKITADRRAIAARVDGDSRAVGCGVSCMLCTGDKEARLIASVNVPACNSQESKPRTPKKIKLATGKTLAHFGNNYYCSGGLPRRFCLDGGTLL